MKKIKNIIAGRAVKTATQISFRLYYRRGGVLKKEVRK
jgi:hypothetical protein